MHARAIAVSLLASLSGLFVAGTMPAHASASGSGFFISPVWVMTNDHVVEGCARVEVAGHGAARDILRDRDLDLAVLRVAQPFPGQARDAMTLQAPVQRRPGQMRDRRLLSMETVVQR